MPVRGVLPEKGPGRKPDGRPANRAHLERLVQTYGSLSGIGPDRVRRWVSTMVLLGALDRVNEAEAPKFLLKGGVAMELRLQADARATRDVDATFFGSVDALEDDLDDAFAEPYSGFELQRDEITPVQDGLFHRVKVKLRYARRDWATLALEIAPAESEKLDAELVDAITIEDFGLEGPDVVQCLSTRYQVAQKLHAVTERHEQRSNERFRDLIDLLLLQELVENLPLVREACVEIFSVRRKHPWPPQLTVPSNWAEPYRTMAVSMSFPVTNVDDAAREVRRFIAAIDGAG